MSPEHHLATYGTLGPGRPNHHQLSGLKGVWSTGSVRGDLYEKGRGADQGFPGLVLNPAGEVASVDLFSSGDLPRHWPRLDAFEGTGYVRVVAEVTATTGVVNAYIYTLAPRPADYRRRVGRCSAKLGAGV